MIDGGENSLRLSFAPVPAERMSEGVSRIAGALERVPRRLARLSYSTTMVPFIKGWKAQ